MLKKRVVTSWRLRVMYKGRRTVADAEKQAREGRQTKVEKHGCGFPVRPRARDGLGGVGEKNGATGGGQVSGVSATARVHDVLPGEERKYRGKRDLRTSGRRKIALAKRVVRGSQRDSRKAKGGEKGVGSRREW